MEDCPDQDDHPAKIYESFTRDDKDA